MRTLLALVIGALAAWGSDLLHPSGFRSLVLPIVSAAAFVYALVRLLIGRPRSSGWGDAGDAVSGDTGCGWRDCSSDGMGDGGGGDGGGGD